MSLARNFMTVITGRLLSQLITLCTIPILARIYTPEHFGVISLLISFTQIPATLFMLRYEQALPQSESDEEAGELLGLCFMIALLFFTLSILITNGIASKLAHIYQQPQLSFVIRLFPLLLMAQACSMLGRQWSAYRERFVPSALSDMCSSCVRRVLPIPLGMLWTPSAWGLITGFMLAPLISALILIACFLRDMSRQVTFSVSRLRQIAIKYQRFPLHLSGVALLDTLSVSAPAIILGHYCSLTEVGWYGQAFALLMLPIALLTQAAARVFYPHLAKERQAGKVSAPLVQKMLLTSLDIGLYPICAVAVIAPDVWALFLGEPFRMSGVLVRILSPYMVMILLWSPISVAINVLHLQSTFLHHTFWLTAGRLIGLWSGAAYGSLWIAVSAYVGVNVIFKIGQLIWLLKKTNVHLSTIGLSMGIRFGYIGVLCAVLSMTQLFEVSVWFKLSVAIIGGLFSLYMTTRLNADISGWISLQIQRKRRGA